MEPTRNLLILYAPRLQAMSDWLTVKAKIEERAPDIEVRIANREARNSVTRRWQASRPSVVFCTSGLAIYEPAGGTIFTARGIAELDQYERLTAAGLPTTRTIELLPGMSLRPDIWGEYVIAKPQGKRTGSDLRLIRAEEVGANYNTLMNSGSGDRMLIKQYVHSVDEEGYPIEYRVLTLFGTVLYAACVRDLEKRPPPAEFVKDVRTIRSSDSMKAARHRTLAFDQEVLDLGRSVAAVFPEMTCLGIDILRDAATGRLFVIEANSGGYVWNFSSARSEAYDPAFRRSLYTQFNALDLTADLLIEKTRAEAS